jgi:hypothetical protein
MKFRVILFLFLTLSISSFSQNVYQWSDGKKWGLTNDAREVLLAPQVDEPFGFFQDRSAFVRVNNKWGILDPSGKFRATPKYDKLEDLSDVFGYASIGDKQFVINMKNGKEIGKQYDAVTEYCYCTEGFFAARSGKKFGILSATAEKLVTKITYDNIKFTYNDRTKAIVTVNKKMGLVDAKSGELVIPVAYDELEDYTSFPNGQRQEGFRGKSGGITKVFTKEGVVMSVKPGDDGGAIMEIMAKDSHEVDEASVVKVSVFVYGPANGEWTITQEKRGNGSAEILQLNTITGYDNVSKIKDMWYPEADKEYLVVTKNGKFGFISSKGNVMIEPAYDSFEPKNNDYFITKLGGLSGVVTKNIVEVKKPVLKSVDEYSYLHKAWLVTIPDGRRGYMTTEGRILIPGIKE